MNKNIIAISSPFAGEEEWLATRESFETGWLTQGPKVAEFERRFAEYHKAPFGIATTSCTTSLHLLLVAMGIGPGDDVLVPAFTWISTVNVILYCGANPVMVDVDPKTNNVTPELLKLNVTDKTKAVIVVHLFGLCVDVAAVRQVLPSHVRIIEDAACATGASINGDFAGTHSDAAAFSLHPRKVITTGEGGMILTRDAELAELLTKLRNHGAEISEEARHLGPKPHILSDFNLLGFNYRMTDIQGAVGVVQLSRLKTLLCQRQQLASIYNDKLSKYDWLVLPFQGENIQHGWQSYVVHVLPEKAPLSRNQIMEIMQEKGVSTRPGTHAVHMQGYYLKHFGYKPEDFPGAQHCHENAMAIPLHNKMTESDCNYIVNIFDLLNSSLESLCVE
ncbi:DegT/DnrJ/EryC1/StrS family aminotransferase [Planctobacterium marinum]|uniref:DegT/DnrJ/EryC1/StrS family aminotransferase n=1 Tax=Planctobacterium marinum TaxID=1631968 RepID=UPI001E5FCAB7|nr:DegT/DnrJ/EryC1/StrS family aminotransferase [Planctobacterium marinum]MCC2606231.1 DegT/DnrJ/EryC1/StrS family aminotransferase [Planctobacterium marinum]